MDFSEAKRQFDIRYYLWSISEFEKEIEEAFPILRSFKAGSPWKTYQFMLNLQKCDQLVLARSLLKRFHAHAVKSLGESCSPNEEELRSRRSSAFSNIVSLGEEIRARTRAGEPVKLASKRKLRKTMMIQFKKAFEHDCIDLAHADEDNEMLRFKIKRAGWIINTFFYFGRREAVLNYSHNIESERTFPIERGEVGMGMAGMISFNSYLGIASQTEWHYLTEEEIEPTCAIAVRLCARFFDVLPKLLIGLECDNLEPYKPTNAHDVTGEK